MLIANLLLTVGTAIMWMGSLVEKDKDRQRNYTIAYVAGLVAIIALNIIA